MCCLVLSGSTGQEEAPISTHTAAAASLDDTTHLFNQCEGAPKSIVLHLMSVGVALLHMVSSSMWAESFERQKFECSRFSQAV